MENSQALQNFLNGTASEEEIGLLKNSLVTGEITIGGNINRSVLIIGNGNTVELPLAALDRLGGRSLLGDLDRDLTGDEIAAGLYRLEIELPLRAPILLRQFVEQTHRLRPSLITNPNSLSDQARKERVEALAQINSLCMEALDISFNALCLGEEPPEYDSCSPFRGLESFRPEDNQFFFGREVLTKKLVDKIQSHPFLAVLGASGSGKSSLVMAGVIPSLKLDYAIIRPGMNPINALEFVPVKPLIVVDQFEELFTMGHDEKTRADFISTLLKSTKSGKVIITLRSDFLSETSGYRYLNEEIQSHLEIIPPMNTDELRRAVEGQARWARLEFEADLSQRILEDVAGEPGAMSLIQHALWELWNRRHGRHLRANEYRASGGVRQAITNTADKVFNECTSAEQEQIRNIFLRLTRLDKHNEKHDVRKRIAVDELVASGQSRKSITFLLEKLAHARLIVNIVSGNTIEIEVAHEALIRYWARLRGWLDEDRDNLRIRESVSESAGEWLRSGKDVALLNHRGGRLEQALSLRDSPMYALNRTEMEYLKECLTLKNKEQHERELRLRTTVIVSIAAAILFLVLGAFGLLKSNESLSRANESATAQTLAEEQQKISQTGELAALSLAQSQSQFDLSLLLGVEAFSSLDTTGTESALLNALQASTHVRHFMFGHEDSVGNVTYTPDGKVIISGGLDQNIIFWDAETGKMIGVPLKSHHGKVFSMDLNPDGTLLATENEDDTIFIWDVATGNPIGSPIPMSNLSGVAFSSKGDLLAGYSDDTVLLMDTGYFSQFGREINVEAYIIDVAFSPDDRYLAISNSTGLITMWDLSTMEIAQEIFPPHNYPIIAFSPDGRILASGGESNFDIVLWDVTTGQQIGNTLRGHTNKINKITFSPNGNYIASASRDNTIIVWDRETGMPIDSAFKGHSDYVLDVNFSLDGKNLVSSGADHAVIVWDIWGVPIIGNSIFANPIGNQFAEARVAFSPQGEILAIVANGEVKFWDRSKNDFVGKTILSGDPYGTGITISPKGDILARLFNSNGNVHLSLWDIETQQEMESIDIPGSSLGSNLAFNPDGTLLALTIGNEIVLWNIETEAIVSPSFVGHTEYVYDVTFSPDGTKLASASLDGTIILWDAETKNIIGSPLKGHTITTTSVAFSPDGKLLASTSNDRTVILWDVDNHSISKILRGHKKAVSTLSFSSDGRFLATGGQDNLIILWDVATGQPIGQPLSGHKDQVISLKFSPNDMVLASGGMDTNIILWNIKPHLWAKIACEIVGRNPSKSEWDLYFHNRKYPQAQELMTCPNQPFMSDTLISP